MGNSRIQNTMGRNCFVEILQNLHFFDYTQDDKVDRAFSQGLVWNKTIDQIKTDKLGIQILVLFFQQNRLSLSNGYVFG